MDDMREDSRRFRTKLDDPFYDGLPDTGRKVVESMPPEQQAFAKWIIMAALERRQSDPPPKKVREWVDWAKWVGGLIIGIASIGWAGKAYVDQFQTKEEARAAQEQQQQATTTLTREVGEQEREVESLRVQLLRLDIQQQTNAERLEALLSLSSADTPAERRVAQIDARNAERRAAERERLLQDAQALRRMAQEQRDSFGPRER